MRLHLAPLLLAAFTAAVPAGTQPPRDSTPGPPIVRRPWGQDTTRFLLRRLPVDSAGRWTLRVFDACDSTQVARTPAGPVRLCEHARAPRR